MLAGVRRGTGSDKMDLVVPVGRDGALVILRPKPPERPALEARDHGRYALTVSRNWRITFAWKGEDAVDVDLEDYHGR